MMNLNLLFNASKLTGNKKYYDATVKHTKTTMKLFIFNAIFYLVRLPMAYASFILRPLEYLYYYYRKGKNNGLIEEIHENLRDMIREQSGREKDPSLGLIDSRSVKTSRNGGEAWSIDGGKKAKGRKQYIITDTLGLVLVVVIHAANIHDSKGAMEVIGNLKGRFPR